MSNTDDRDEELSKLERALTAPPHIHEPETKNLGGGAMCWLNADRVCGADCVAFNIDGVGLPEDEAVQGPNQCTVLVYAGQIGAGSLAQIQLLKKSKIAAADAARNAAAQSKPPEVR